MKRTDIDIVIEDVYEKGMPIIGIGTGGAVLTDGGYIKTVDCIESLIAIKTCGLYLQKGLFAPT